MAHPFAITVLQRHRPLVLLAICLLILSPVSSLAQSRTNPPPRSLIQKLRDFLGLTPPVAVGGSRSSDHLQVCLLSPRPIQSNSTLDATANAPRRSVVPVVVGLSNPLILASGSLNEIRLERNNSLLWQQRASSTQPINGPIPWPIAPLAAGEVVTLKLRPIGVPGGDFAVFDLRVVDAATLQANESTIQALGTNSKLWFRALNQLTPQQAPLAAALLSSANAPAALRQAIGCTDR
jgi:hypothetical protein